MSRIIHNGDTSSSIKGGMMSAEALLKAVELGDRMQHVFVATSDRGGLPHLAAAGIIRTIAEDRIGVEAWFCPATIENLSVNPLISVVAWDPAADTGHQILGEVDRIEEIAMMNGFSPELEGREQLPQAEKRLVIRVTRVIAFSHAPHSDAVE